MKTPEAVGTAHAAAPVPPSRQPQAASPLSAVSSGSSVHPARVECFECDGAGCVWRSHARINETCPTCNGHGAVCSWCGSRLNDRHGDGMCVECISIDGEREAAASKAEYLAQSDLDDVIEAAADEWFASNGARL